MSKKTKAGAGAPAASMKASTPFHVVYEGVDFGLFNPGRFSDPRYNRVVIENAELEKRIEHLKDEVEKLDEEDAASQELVEKIQKLTLDVFRNSARGYDLLFGKDNVDEIFDKLADIHGGELTYDHLNAFMTFIARETNAKK